MLPQSASEGLAYSHFPLLTVPDLHRRSHDCGGGFLVSAAEPADGFLEWLPRGERNL